MQKAGHQAGTWPLAWDARQGRRRAEDSLALSRAGCFLLAGPPLSFRVLEQGSVRADRGLIGQGQSICGVSGVRALWPSPLASPVLLPACPPTHPGRPAPLWTREDSPGWTRRRASHRPMCEGIPQTMRGSLAACRRRGGERPGERSRFTRILATAGSASFKARCA